MKTIDPFRLFALLQVFAIAADGLGAEFLLAAIYRSRLRPTCVLPFEVLVLGLQALRDDKLQAALRAGNP